MGYGNIHVTVLFPQEGLDRKQGRIGTKFAHPCFEDRVPPDSGKEGDK